ncbi:hypothetical protein BOTCAL_0377g00090 [Botryotinia calthae]|uniref:Uncharacterized protein n=1 Tax=Botryotinia calthae TaxID=38488 RepID=A0A4Y8CRP6_9HELO|nr:hypothetical protein BOTCAL_0377g00090 [Botryotinia calthae]
MENLVEPDNRFKIKLRETLLDTTGFKQIRVRHIGSQLWLSWSSVGGPRSRASKKYIPWTAVGKRFYEIHTAIDERYGEKRYVMFTNANKNTAQDIEADTFEAEDWDTKNTLIFNLQMINASASEIVLGMKPPPCSISAPLFKEYDRALLSVHVDYGGENNYKRVKDEDENKLTTDQSGAKGSFAPTKDMKGRLGLIYQLPDDDDI